MAFDIHFNEEKNQLLKATRVICFDDVIQAIEDGNLLADLKHRNPNFPHQRVYAVVINKYVYAIPYVRNEKKQEIFLKTAYPSRALTKRYLRGGKNEKKYKK